MKDNFVAEICNFQGEDGYMVSQIHNGKEVVKQFIPESSYDIFCNTVGVVPEVLGACARLSPQ